MKVFTATVASDGPYELGEGPVWDEARERVLWVDINAGTVYGGHLEGGFVTADTEMRFGETVGAVVCDADGQLLVAGARRLYRVVGDGRAVIHADLVPDAKRQPAQRRRAAIRPAVSSWAAWRSTARQGEECLYRLDDGGEVAVHRRDLTISNGLAWSPGRRGHVQRRHHPRGGVVATLRSRHRRVGRAHGGRPPRPGRLARRPVRGHRRQPVGGDLGRRRGPLLHARRANGWPRSACPRRTRRASPSSARTGICC